MNNLIDRQEAVGAIDRYYKDKKYITRSRTILSAICQDMKNIMGSLPSAQPEPRWIPCSERLPRKKCRYMVTRYDYFTKKEFIDIMWYEKKIWWNVHPMGGDYAVTAWMPLPEPYEE